MENYLLIYFHRLQWRAEVFLKRSKRQLLGYNFSEEQLLYSKSILHYTRPNINILRVQLQ